MAAEEEGEEEEAVAGEEEVEVAEERQPEVQLQEEEEMRNSSEQSHPLLMGIARMSTDSCQTSRGTCR